VVRLVDADAAAPTLARSSATRDLARHAQRSVLLANAIVGRMCERQQGAEILRGGLVRPLVEKSSAASGIHVQSGVTLARVRVALSPRARVATVGLKRLSVSAVRNPGLAATPAANSWSVVNIDVIVFAILDLATRASLIRRSGVTVAHVARPRIARAKWLLLCW
jgi:hypothetical protein